MKAKPGSEMGSLVHDIELSFTKDYSLKDYPSYNIGKDSIGR